MLHYGVNSGTMLLIHDVTGYFAEIMDITYPAIYVHVYFFHCFLSSCCSAYLDLGLSHDDWKYSNPSLCPLSFVLCLDS